MQNTDKAVKRVIPVPAAFMARTGGWKIEHNPNGAFVSHENGIYSAPLSDDVKSAATRAHEYGHLVYSPANMRAGCVDSGAIDSEDIEKALADPRFSYCYNAVEDSRINQIIYDKLRPVYRTGSELTNTAFLAAIKLQYLDARKQATPKKLAKMETEQAKSLLLLTMAKLPAGIFTRTLRPRGWPGIREYYYRNIKANSPLVIKCISSPIDRQALAGCLYDLPRSKNAAGIAYKIYRLLYDNEDGTARMQPSECTGSVSDALKGVTWEIRKLPLVNDKRRSLGIKRIACDYGVVPRKIHNMLASGRIFDRKGKSKGGTVLIDNSGSMRLSHSDIVELVRKAPAATVAVYDADDNHGVLRIVARDGQMASAETIRASKVGGCNTIDYYVVKWLGKQAEPRLWVCDGQVTGKDDNIYPELTRETMKTARLARVKRLDGMADAIAYFR